MKNTIDATKVDVVQEQIDNLRDKSREVDALYTQLENSHRITKLVPDAFEHGACKQTWVNVDKETVNFKVTRGDGSVREIPFEELPEDFVNHLIKEKEIAGSIGLDYKINGRTMLTRKLSRFASARKNKRLVKKRIEQRRNS